jgi:hypothetical protein
MSVHSILFTSLVIAMTLKGTEAQITQVSMSLAVADAVAFKTNAAPVTFSFTSARVLPAGQRITIALPANYFEGRANPVGTVVSVNPVAGVAMPTLTCALVTTPQCVISCVTAGSILEARSYRVVFDVEQLSTGSARAQQTNGLTISTTVDDVGVGASPTLLLCSIVFENVADLYSQKRTSGFVNVSFFVTNLLPAGGRITIHLPNGFFTASLQPSATVFCSGDAPSVSCTLFTNSIICTTSIHALRPGYVVLRFMPATLTTGISRNETRDVFKIETSSEAGPAAFVTPAIAAGRVRMLFIFRTPFFFNFHISFHIFVICNSHSLQIQHASMAMSEVDQNARKTTTSPVSFFFTAQSDIQVGNPDTRSVLILTILCRLATK